MRKNLFRIIFIFVLGFLFLSKIEATNYTYDCKYIYVDEDLYNMEWYYTFSFEATGNTLNLTQAVLHEDLGYDSVLDIEMQNVKWENGKDCPGYITITEKGNTKKAELGIKENGKVLTHYWTWNCFYSIETKEDELGFINMQINYINYYNFKNKFIVRTWKISDSLAQPINSFKIYHNNLNDNVEKYGKYENQCIPLKLNISNHIINFSFDDAGENNGQLVDVSYNKEVLTTTQSTCLDYRKKTSCETDSGVACIWQENEDALDGGFCNVDNLLFVGCGGAQDIPAQVPQIISLVVNLLKIATPIILIFMGMISLFKAMAAGKEDEMKKAQSSLVKKIISATLVFFVVAIVQFIISVVAEDDEYSGFENCLNCFLNNNCVSSTYYKTVIGGEDYCTTLHTKKTSTCSDFFKVVNKLTK